MDVTKKTILSKLEQRLPQCKGSIQMIDVPNIFYGDETEPKPGASATAPIADRYDLPDGQISSVLPNPTNSLNVGQNAVLVPHPQNNAFAKYLGFIFNSLGVKLKFEDTSDYAHLGDGNLHCITHAVPICRP